VALQRRPLPPKLAIRQGQEAPWGCSIVEDDLGRPPAGNFSCPDSPPCEAGRLPPTGRAALSFPLAGREIAQGALARAPTREGVGGEAAQNLRDAGKFSPASREIPGNRRGLAYHPMGRSLWPPVAGGRMQVLRWSDRAPLITPGISWVTARVVPQPAGRRLCAAPTFGPANVTKAQAGGLSALP
jgi:hypothetical protein